MSRPYTSKDYEVLARAVLAGMPEDQAEKILEEQRTEGARGEETYWLTLREGASNAKTTIQITQGLKTVLNDIKEHPKDSYEDSIKRLVYFYEIYLLKIAGIEIFVDRIEEIIDYYKRHRKDADYQDLKNALDEYRGKKGE